MEKRYKLSIIQSLTYRKKKFLMVFPEKAMYPFDLFLDFAPEIKKGIVGISSD